MNVWALIGQSYALPFQRLGALFKVFWWPLLLWAMLAIGTDYGMRDYVDMKTMSALDGIPAEQLTEEQALAVQTEGLKIATAYGVLIVALLFYTIIAASALVRWHRYLINDDAPTSAGNWLNRSEWWFLWRWCMLGLAFVLLGMVAMLIVMGIIMATMGIEQFAIAMQVAGPQQAQVMATMMAWTFVLAMGLTGWFFPRTFLSLAAIAVGHGAEYRQNAKQAVTKADCSALTLAILVTTAPFLLAGLGLPMLFQPEDPNALVAELTPTYVAAMVIANLFNFLSIVVFATMLSLFYRERVLNRGDISASGGAA